MNREDASGAWWRPLVRVGSTVIVFATVGVAIGLAITVGGYILVSFHPSFSKFALVLYAATAYGLFLVYPLYLLPGIGLYLAARGEMGHPRFEEAALVAALLASLWALLLANSSMHGRAAALVVGSSVVATLACWKLARWSRRRL